MSSVRWDAEIAEVYDETYAAMFELSVLGPMADVLAELAGGGPALEFAIGTGRVALPLSARGIPVRGIELSPAMAERLSAKPGSDDVPVTIGDMTTARVPGSSPSIPATSESRPSTTSWGRSRGPITGSPRGDGWCATRRPTATSGRPSST